MGSSDKPRFVQIGIQCYDEGILDAAFNTVVLEKIKAAVDSSETTRSLMRGIRGLKDRRLVPVVMAEAARRVATLPGITEKDVEAKGGTISARFPLDT